MFDKTRFSTGEFLSDLPVSAPVSEPVSVPSWHTDTNYSLDFRSYLKKIYGNNELKDNVLNSLAEVWKKNPSLIITAANEKTKAADNKALQERRAAEERIRNARSQWNLDNAKYAVKVEPKEAPVPASASAPSNDFSNVANFNEAFRQASKAGLKTFVWKKTKGNPSGLFSTEVASKQSNTEKPVLQPKEKNSGESAPASKVQPQTKTKYAFDGRHIDIGRMPYIDEDQGYTEFGHNSELNTIPDETSVLPYLYPWDTTITNPHQWLKLPESEPESEITGNALSDQLRKQLEEYMKYHNGVRYKFGYGRDSNFMAKGGTMNKVNYFSQGGTTPNGQADAFMQSVLQGDSKAIGQLVDAANQGDKNAAKLIKTILQEDLKGNQQVTKAASVIKQLLNQTTSAKWGSKLEYIRSLKFAKGGKSCPVCEQQKVEMKKCGGKKAKKRYFGGYL